MISSVPPPPDASSAADLPNLQPASTEAFQILSVLGVVHWQTMGDPIKVAISICFDVCLMVKMRRKASKVEA